MSFWKDIESVFGKLFGSKAAWEQTAASTLTVVGPLVQTVVTLAGGAALGTAVGNVLSQVKNDLAAAIVILQSNPGGSAKAQAQALITAIDNNLQTILQDADIKNSAKLTDITATVQLISGELQGILSSV